MKLSLNSAEAEAQASSLGVAELDKIKALCQPGKSGTSGNVTSKGRKKKRQAYML